MGKRKDQDAVFAARIRELSADLYPSLLARAMDPFSKADTNPFRASGHAGDKYVYIRYCPDRDTRTPLGSPEFVQGVVRQLLVENTASSDGMAHVPSKKSPPQNNHSEKINENGAAGSHTLGDLQQALEAAIGDQERHDQPAITASDDLPRNPAEAVGIAELSAPDGAAAAYLTVDERRNGNTDSKAVSLKPPTKLSAQIQQDYLQHVHARGVAHLSGSYWQLPMVATIVMALVLMIGSQLAPGSSRSPSVTFAAPLSDLPQVEPSNSSAANAVSIDARSPSYTPDDLLQPIKPETLTAAVRGELASLFAALCGASGHDRVVEQANGVVRVPINIDGAHACGELLENYLFRSQYSSSAQEDVIRKLIRTGITQVSMRDGALFMEVRNPAAYEQAITDREDPSRKLSGFGVGHLWLAFKAEHIQVTEVSP